MGWESKEKGRRGEQKEKKKKDKQRRRLPLRSLTTQRSDPRQARDPALNHGRTLGGRSRPFQGACGAFEQLAERRLERGKAPAHRRRIDAQQVRPARKRAAAMDSKQHP